MSNFALESMEPNTPKSKNNFVNFKASLFDILVFMAARFAPVSMSAYTGNNMSDGPCAYNDTTGLYESIPEYAPRSQCSILSMSD